MSDTTHYDMKMAGTGFDPEFAVFKLLRDVPEAKHYFDENGKATGNGYDWRSLEEDMRRFSVTQPAILFTIVERGSYDSESFEYRHYFKAGCYAKIEPKVVVTWPEFTEDMLNA